MAKYSIFYEIFLLKAAMMLLAYNKFLLMRKIIYNSILDISRAYRCVITVEVISKYILKIKIPTYYSNKVTSLVCL